MPGSREFDVVLFGATGFVGRLTADYLARHAPEGARVALAGRSQQRVADVRGSLGPPAASWGVVVADTSDPSSLEAMAKRSAVVATTVGPYASYGLPVVEACAGAGTHYADLTGEVAFMRTSIDRFHDTAAATGARIVHACGFDSIPSDLGVLTLHERVQADGAGDLGETTLVVTGMKGGLSGGTIASAKVQIEQMRRDPALRRLVRDPHALEPQAGASAARGERRGLLRPSYDRDLRRWLAPFVMAGTNTRVVRRSNSLQDQAYGRGFRYHEVMGMPGGPLGLAQATAVTGALGTVATALALPPTRAVLDRLLPAPGEGPSEKLRSMGYFRIEIHTTTSTGARYVARVAAEGDPGYAATSVMFGESALALAFDADRLPARSGVLTPATALGRPVVQRLRRQGFTFEAQPR